MLDNTQLRIPTIARQNRNNSHRRTEDAKNHTSVQEIDGQAIAIGKKGTTKSNALWHDKNLAQVASMN